MKRYHGYVVHKLRRLRSIFPPGYTLIVVLIVIALLSVLSLTGFGVITFSLKGSTIRQGGVEAMYAAEAGVSDVMNKLNNDPTWKSWFINAPQGGGTTSKDLTATVVDSTKSYSGTVVAKCIDASTCQAEITVTGKSVTTTWNAQRKVVATVWSTVNPSSSPSGPVQGVALYTWQNLLGTNFTNFDIHGASTQTDGDMDITNGTEVDLGSLSGYKAYYFGNFPNQSGAGFSPTNWKVTPTKILQKSYAAMTQPDVAALKTEIFSKMNVVTVSIPSHTNETVVNGDFSVTTSYSTNKNLYVKGNINVANGASLLVSSGYVFADGGLRVGASAYVRAKGIYLMGTKPYFTGSTMPPGSWEVGSPSGSGTTYYLYSSNVYVKGDATGKISAINSGNNLQIDGNTVSLTGGSGSFAGSINVPNGDLTFTSSGWTFGDLYAKNSATFTSVTSTSVRSMYTDGALNWNGSAFRAPLTQEANVYAGGPLTISGTNASLDLQGMLLSNTSVTLNGAASSSWRISDNSSTVLKSGIITPGPITIAPFSNVTIKGLIWSGGTFTLCNGLITGSAAWLTGGVMASTFTTNGTGCTYGLNRFDLTYDWSDMSPFSTAGGSGSSGALTIFNWKEQ